MVSGVLFARRRPLEIGSAKLQGNLLPRHQPQALGHRIGRCFVFCSKPIRRGLLKPLSRPPTSTSESDSGFNRATSLRPRFHRIAKKNGECKPAPAPYPERCVLRKPSLFISAGFCLRGLSSGAAHLTLRANISFSIFASTGSNTSSSSSKFFAATLRS